MLSRLAKVSGSGGPVRVDLALIHYPVVNKKGETIGSAITNLDLHDLARAARTFGVDTLYLVTPYQDQQRLFSEILEHWRSGHGAGANPARSEALGLVRLCNDLEELHGLVAQKWGRPPQVLVTSARPQQRALSYAEVRERIWLGEPMLILLGTAWGLAPEVMQGAEGALAPIQGAGDYNHLSVRSAAAIVLDRLLGQREGLKT